jgi:hypothetical protein
MVVALSNNQCRQLNLRKRHSLCPNPSNKKPGKQETKEGSKKKLTRDKIPE